MNHLFSGLPGVAFWFAACALSTAGRPSRGSGKNTGTNGTNGTITIDQLSHHSTRSSAWIAINGQVYDVTRFLSAHPGGAGILLKYSGKDGSRAFNSVHTQNMISTYLKAEDYVGAMGEKFARGPDDDAADAAEAQRQARRRLLPKLSRVFNLHDFEVMAKGILTPTAWAYYAGGADDEYTLNENHQAYRRLMFHPKVLVDVRSVDLSTEMLGQRTEAPFYCSAAALAALGHDDGELSIARGCKKEGIVQMISNSASYGVEEIVSAAREVPGTVAQWFQLYVKPDRAQSVAKIRQCEDLGIRAIFITVDTPVLGRREADFRVRLPDEEDDNENDNDNDDSFAVMNNYEDPGLCWDDISRFRQTTTLPIAVKGIQRVEDAVRAAEMGVNAVVLSNHGGRQMEFSRAPIDVLAEVMPALRERNLHHQMEVYVDGGVRRGTDVLKALCLGAKGVGLGRSFLYANSCYGEKGVIKAIHLLKHEVAVGMKLLGVTRVEELGPEMVLRRQEKE